MIHKPMYCSLHWTGLDWIVTQNQCLPDFHFRHTSKVMLNKGVKKTQLHGYTQTEATKKIVIVSI